MTPSGATTLGLSGPGIDGNEEGGSYLSAEMQSAYSKAPADWASYGLVWFGGFYGISTFVGYLAPNPFLCKNYVLFKRSYM